MPEHLHIDGFRFDLGTILAREVYGFDEQSGFLKAVDQDPVLTSVKLSGRLSGRRPSAGLGGVER
jgi:pullulanase/glycogen debranching enzyme